MRDRVDEWEQRVFAFEEQTVETIQKVKSFKKIKKG